jgi:uncharacterized repeat protein (TIGR01451 family)
VLPVVTVTIQSGASLVSTLIETLGSSGFASVGQVVPYTFAVQNLGSATANVTSVGTTIVVGSATCTAPTPAASAGAPVPVAGAATVNFTFTCTPSAAGTLTVRASASGVDVNTLAPVSTSATTSYQVQTAAAVTATSVTASQATVSVGQPFTLSLSLSKTGTAAANVTGVTLNAAAAAICTGQTPPTPVNGIGAAQAFQWTCTPTAAGALTLGASATWVDANLGTPQTTAVPTTVVTVQTAAVVSAATPTVSLAQVDANQSFALQMTVTKTGAASATVSSITLNAAALAICSSQSPATPVASFPASQVFTWTCSAPTAGARALSATVNWIDVNVGAPRTSTPTPTASVNVTVQSPPSLAASIAVESPVVAGANFTVTMTVTNSGEATASSVSPTALTAAPGNTGSAVLVSGPTGSPATIAGGGGPAVFTWLYNNTGSGSFAVQGGASGLSANSGVSYTAPQVTSSPAMLNLRAGSPEPAGGEPAPEVASIWENPLGDGTSAPLIAAWQGAVWVGPSGDGRSFARLDPTSVLGPRLSGIAVGLDEGSTPMRNGAWTASGMATTLGALGCDAGSAGCGPDGEQGAAALAGGGIFGSDLLAFAGRGSGARYVYAASAATSPVVLAWVDMGAALAEGGAPGSPSRPTALHLAPGAPDRLYVGYASDTGPQLLALETPPGDGLDAAPGTDVVDLAIGTLPAVSGGQGVTALADVAGVLYVGHGAGVVRAEVPTPGSAVARPGDWAPATPSAAAWSERVGVAMTAAGPVLPSDRAVAALAAFGRCGAGPCLFMARNVLGSATQPATVGQLWRCEPTAGPGKCAPGDWTLALASPAGDPARTEAGAETNGALTVLAATRTWLYVGFDNMTTGVQLFRSASVPRSVTDLKGRGGCAASSAGCEGLGGNGFGRARNTRVLDARVLDAGAGPELWLVVGDGTGPASVYRIAD